MRLLPRINGKYWLALMAASVFGTNTGDLFADYFHLGHLAGLPWLVIAFAVILLAERFSPVASVLFFWAVIITVRTAATNVGDAFQDFHIGFDISLPVVLALFVVCVAIYRWAGKGQDKGDAVVRVGPLYWLCMVMAGILGTIGGDYASFGLHLMPPGTFVVFGILVAILLFIGRGGRNSQPIYYWLCLAFIRTAGTGGGDALAHQFGLLPSTIATGVVFVALIVWFYSVETTNRVDMRQAASA